MTLNQWQVLQKSMLFKKLLNHSSTHTALTGVKNKIFWTKIGTVSSEAECFKFISCKLKISLEKNIIFTQAHLMLFTQLSFYSTYDLLSRVPPRNGQLRFHYINLPITQQIPNCPHAYFMWWKYLQRANQGHPTDRGKENYQTPLKNPQHKILYNFHLSIPFTTQNKVWS